MKEGLMITQCEGGGQKERSLQRGRRSRAKTRSPPPLPQAPPGPQQQGSGQRPTRQVVDAQGLEQQHDVAQVGALDLSLSGGVGVLLFGGGWGGGWWWGLRGWVGSSDWGEWTLGGGARERGCAGQPTPPRAQRASRGPRASCCPPARWRSSRRCTGGSTCRGRCAPRGPRAGWRSPCSRA